MIRIKKLNGLLDDDEEDEEEEEDSVAEDVPVVANEDVSEIEEEEVEVEETLELELVEGPIIVNPAKSIDSVIRTCSGCLSCK